MTSFDAAIPATGLPMPAHAHVPGSGTKPDMTPLEAAKAMETQTTVAADWQTNRTYIFGFALLRGGYFWEAHEVWERVWLASPANSRERRLLRALIQIANARLKQRMGRARAAERLYGEARQELAGLGVRPIETFMGVDVERLLLEIADL